MCDRDIRNFFRSDGNKSSTNQSNMIKQLTLDPKKDIKKITKNPKIEKKETKEKKTKVKISEEEKEKEKKEFLTPMKKKVIELKKNNIQLNKQKFKTKNKKIILDEEDDSENIDIIKKEKEAGKIEEKQKTIKNEIIVEKEIYNISYPIKKEEKLVPISVSEFFSSKKITLKSDEKPEEIKEKKQIIDEIIDENKMKKEEEEKKKMEKKEKKKKNEGNNNEIKKNVNNKKTNKNFIKEEKNNVKKHEKNNNNKKEKEKNNDNIDIDENLIEDMIVEDETNNKKEETTKIKEKKIEKKIINLSKEEQSQKEVKNKSIIKREIKREIKNTSNNLNINKEIKSNENINKLPISELWTDKYIPNQISDIIGNQQQLRNLEQWLDDWNYCILKGHKKQVNKTGKKNTKNENINARAAIISGPPGIGKTSSVRVLTKIKGYRTFELNASDKRNKDTINNSVGFLMNNTTLSSIDNSTNTKNIIIMDEIDGMAGNEDKGGIKALIDIVKKTKIPIIFICNDIYSPKLKSLINYCYDIRFFKPDKRQIVLRLIDICKKEEIFVDNQTLTFIVESFGNDIRQTINYLDLYSRDKKEFNNIKKNCEEVKKDKSVTVGSFDITKILLNKNESLKLNFGQKLDLFFVDFDLIPGMIQENYINTAKINNNSPDKIESLQKIIEGMDHISFSDTIENKMKSQMEWSLLPDKGIHSTVIPSMIFSSFLSFPKFPEFYNKISKIMKINRELKELKKIFFDYSLFEIKNEVSPLFFNIIIDKMVTNGKDGLDEIVDIFTFYRMNANLFKENLYDLQSKENQTLYNKINTSLKTNLTKKLNERFKTSLKQHKTRTIMMPQIKVDKDGNIIDDDYEFDDVEEEVDEQSSSFFEPIKKSNKKKNK